MRNAYRAFPEVLTPSGLLRLARNYSDGIVPDLHRVPFQSITELILNRQQPKYELSARITFFPQFVHTFAHSAYSNLLYTPKKKLFYQAKAF